MGLFDIFCNVVAGGAAAQHDYDVHGPSGRGAHTAASQARNAPSSSARAWGAGYAGNAAHLKVTGDKRTERS